MPLTNISNEDFSKLVKFIHSQYGIDLSQKRQLVTSRLSSLLSQKGYNDFGPFVTDLLKKQDPADMELVLNQGIFGSPGQSVGYPGIGHRYFSEGAGFC